MHCLSLWTKREEIRKQNACLILCAILCLTSVCSTYAKALEPPAFTKPEPVPMKCETVFHLETEAIYDDAAVLTNSADQLPRDNIMRNRALLKQVLQISSDDVCDQANALMRPEYLLGTLIKETGGEKMCRWIDETDWLTELAVRDRPCEKGNCWYNRLGISHFVGGHVSGGKDIGDPYTMEINCSWSSYNQAKAAAEANGDRGDHALGFVQFEVPYVNGRMNYQFPEERLGISELNFIRPNFFYVPDQIYNMAFMLSGCAMSDPIYWEIVESPEYLAMDERNQAFVQFTLQQTAYACGHLVRSNKTLLKELNRLLESGEVEYFDQMLLPFKDKFYSKETKQMVNYDNWGCREYIYDTYGIYINGLDTVPWSGVYAACAGRMAWEAMSEDVAETVEAERANTLNLNGFQALSLEGERQ